MGRMVSSDLPNAPLPRWESRLCITAWITIAFLLMVSLFKTSKDFAEHRDVNYDLDPGWSCIGRQKDVTDIEWEFWRDTVFGVLGKWLIGHVIMGQLLRHSGLFVKRKYFYLIYSLIFYICAVGFGPWLLLTLEAFAVFLVVWFTASPLLVWTMTLMFLMALNFQCLREPLVLLNLLKKGNFHVFYFQEFSLCVSVLRLTSFGLCYCELNKRSAKLTISLDDATEESSLAHLQGGCSGSLVSKQKISETKSKDRQENLDSRSAYNLCSAISQLLDMFFYVFYLPLFVAGPLMNYDVFCRQFYRSLEPWSFCRLKPIILGFSRFLFWGLSYELLLHYLYSGAIINKPSLLRVLPLWSVAGAGYANGMFFVLKYIIIWAFCSSVARLDQLDPPDVPSCGSHIYLYSKMWKTFDRGLYAFLKQHIYILLGGSRHGLFRRMVALVACFGFIALWHGLHDYILIWCLFNFITILLEGVAGTIVSSPTVMAYEAKHLSPAMIRRLHSLAIVPLLGLSTFSLVAFFAGLQPSAIMFYRLLIEGFPISTFLVVVSLYCVIQTGKEIENYQASHQSHKQD